MLAANCLCASGELTLHHFGEGIGAISAAPSPAHQVTHHLAEMSSSTEGSSDLLSTRFARAPRPTSENLNYGPGTYALVSKAKHFGLISNMGTFKA